MPSLRSKAAATTLPASFETLSHEDDFVNFVVLHATTTRGRARLVRSGGARPTPIPPMASMSVFRVAVLSRVATLTLMFAFDALVDDYDTSGALEPEGLSVPASFACRRLEGVVTWDSVYFARVASEGYEHEQAHAFFPSSPR